MLGANKSSFRRHLQLTQFYQWRTYIWKATRLESFEIWIWRLSSLNTGRPLTLTHDGVITSSLQTDSTSSSAREWRKQILRRAMNYDCTSVTAFDTSETIWHNTNIQQRSQVNSYSLFRGYSWQGCFSRCLMSFHHHHHHHHYHHYRLNSISSLQVGVRLAMIFLHFLWSNATLFHSY